MIGDGEAEWDAARCINLVVSADLFIVPLDAAAEWHRFHSLFRKMLRQRLAAGLPAEAVNELHRRAAAWLADHELFDDALHHALRANDYDLMAELIGRALPAVSKREGRLTLERWLSYVPETYAASRPELLVLKAWTLHFMYLAEGKLEQVRQAAHDLLRLAEGSNLPTLQSWAHDFLGRMHYQWNELDVAERHLSAILDKRHTAVSIIVGEGLYCLAELYHHQGNDAGAAQIVELLGELDLEHCAPACNCCAGMCRGPRVGRLTMPRPCRTARWSGSTLRTESRPRFCSPQAKGTTCSRRAGCSIRSVRSPNAHTTGARRSNCSRRARWQCAWAARRARRRLRCAGQWSRQGRAASCASSSSAANRCRSC